MRRNAILPVLFAAAVLFALTAAAGTDKPQGEKAAVEVRLSEYAIQMPQTLPAGPATFAIRNEGQKSHSFRIEGPGIESSSVAILRPGETANLQVTLQPGEYKVYCPIGSHSAKGMTMKLTVNAG
jgi:plastocyanin